MTESVLHDGVERRLDPAWITVARIAGWVRAIVLASGAFLAAGIVIAAVRPGPAGLALVAGGWVAVVAALAAAAHFWPKAAFRHSRWRLDDRGIEIRRGVLWRTIVHVPRSRVQHTDVVQGPLQRRFGLATLVIFTAGTHHASVPIPGLRRDVAERVRDFLVAGGGSDAV